MNISDTVSLASSLIRFRSLSGSEGPITDFLARTLADRGWPVERLPVVDGRENIFVAFGTPSIVFTTHTDVVPGPDNLFEPVVRDGLLYGRGACDTKGIIATMISLADQLRSRGESNFGLLFVVGEETDGIGARTASQQLQGRGIKYIVNGEPTECKVMRAHKGSLGLSLTCTGVACHSGYPEQGKDANAQLIRILSRILECSWPTDPLLGPTTVNIGVVQAGMAANIVSPLANAEVIFRTVSANAQIMATVQELCGDECSIEVPYQVEPVYCSEIPGMPSDVAAYCTDIPFFAPLGAACVLYGPGSILAAHTHQEHIALQQIEDALLGYDYIFHQLKQKL
jgi:acetylornithine deacetylase